MRNAVVWWAWIGVAVAAAGAVAQQPGVTPIRYNVAEAIIEPFWSSELSGFAEWTVEPGDGHGLVIFQNWAAVDFEWASKPAEGPALSMWRDFDVDCRNYDRLVLRLAPPRGAVVRMTVSTDRGERSFASPPAAENREEYALDLAGAARLGRITLAIEPGAEGPGVGWLRWIGLQNSAMMDVYDAQWDYSNFRWDAHLRSADHPFVFSRDTGSF